MLKSGNFLGEDHGRLVPFNNQGRVAAYVVIVIEKEEETHRLTRIQRIPKRQELSSWDTGKY